LKQSTQNLQSIVDEKTSSVSLEQIGQPTTSSTCQYGGKELGKPDLSKRIDAKFQKPNVGIITNENFTRSGETPLNNLVALLSPLTNRLFVITGDYSNSTPGVQVIKIKFKPRGSVAARALQQVLTHLRVLRILAKLHSELDILIQIFGTPFPVPLVFAQALNTRVFIIFAQLGPDKPAQGLKESGASPKFGELTKFRIEAALARISYYFANELIVYSPSVIDEMKLRSYEKKIVVAHRHFVNFDEYRFMDSIEQRDNLVGYVGRIHAEKGIRNFVEAIPKILSVQDDVTFLIVGEGPLEDEIRAYLEEHDLRDKVKLAGWISHQELPDYLTRLKLLVLPSYNEGLPNVMLEAIACGTPVLAASIASIPDVIKDKETGFLFHDNSPACLAETIVETLARSDLKRIVRNARTLVESEFRYEKLTATWKDIICGTKDDV
jgi:glycosyltransferase involved in cell wall biosynthesis